MKTVTGVVPQPPPSKIDFASYESPQDFDHDSFDENGNRFVAGDQFYNHEMYGSLRKGGAVDFLSMDCLGLAAATFTSMFSYQSLLNVLQPMYSTQMGLDSQEITAVARLIQMPMALSFFIGLLSDCYPIMGLRRKGYMIVGLILNAVSVFAIAGLSAFFDTLDAEPRDGTLKALALVLAAAASFGCIITYLCVHTRVIELSQRESLRERGSIQYTYLVFRRWVSLLATLFNFLTIGNDTTNPNVSLAWALVLLGIISVAPLPLILKYWKEEVYSLNTSFKIRGQIFWKIMQQKAVWRVMAFICFFTLFLGIQFSDSIFAVRAWAGAATDNAMVIKTISDIVMMLTMVVWRYVFMNRLWPSFFALAPAFQIIPHLIIASLVCFEVVRDRYMYRVFISLTNVSDGIGLLNTIVPITEIIQEGSEGALVGLSLTLQRAVNIFVNANSVGLWRGDNFYDPAEVKADSSDAHWDVFLSLLLMFAINALALIGLFFLPSQKLDAQQLRMYGGFTKAASSAIVIFCSVIFLYGMVITLLTLIPSMSCYTLFGGAGCDN